MIEIKPVKMSQELFDIVMKLIQISPLINETVKLETALALGIDYVTLCLAVMGEINSVALANEIYNMLLVKLDKYYQHLESEFEPSTSLSKRKGNKKSTKSGLKLKNS